MKNIVFDSKEIVITYLLSYGILIGASAIYVKMGYLNLDTFLNQGCVIILLIFYIGVSCFLYFKNRSLEVYQEKISPPDIYPLITLGISIASLMNMIIFFFHPVKSTTTIALPLAILSSGIIGPIYEEILFRFLLYNRLRKQYSIKIAMGITTIIFALSHLSLIKIIYAFILGIILVLVYEDKKNLLAPILVHIGANSIVLFLGEYNTYVFFLSIICFIVGIKCYLLTKK